jgi:hypothetical protein
MPRPDAITKPAIILIMINDDSDDDCYAITVLFILSFRCVAHYRTLPRNSAARHRINERLYTCLYIYI